MMHPSWSWKRARPPWAAAAAAPCGAGASTPARLTREQNQAKCNFGLRLELFAKINLVPWTTWYPYDCVQSVTKMPVCNTAAQPVATRIDRADGRSMVRSEARLARWTSRQHLFCRVAMMFQLVHSCDWACEPWAEFDGAASRVLEAQNGAPTAWRLNETLWVQRMIYLFSCMDQTLLFVGGGDPGGAACSEAEMLPDAIVQMGRASTAIGGAPIVGHAPWLLVQHRRLGANESADDVAGSRRVYAFGAAASAVVDRWSGWDAEGAAWRLKKRIVVRQHESQVRVHVAVNIRASC